MSEDTERTEESPNAFTRPGFVISALFLAMVIVFAVIVTLNQDGSAPVPKTAPATSEPDPFTPAPAASGCRPTDTDLTIPDQAPRGVTWSLFSVAVVPYSGTAGPLLIQGDLALCYARTPLGALLAMAQIPSRLVLSTDWATIIRRQVAAGPGRTLMANSIAQARQGKSAGAASAGSVGQIAGFRYVTYTPDVAVAQLVGRTPAGVMAVVTMTVVWQDGDWKLQLQPTGQPGPPAQRISTLDGYVPWGGV